MKAAPAPFQGGGHGTVRAQRFVHKGLASSVRIWVPDGALDLGAAQGFWPSWSKAGLMCPVPHLEVP